MQGKVIDVADIPVWSAIGVPLTKQALGTLDIPSEFSYSAAANERVALWDGDMTKLKIDAIVNASNRYLGNGGGINGAIHRAAGSKLPEYMMKTYPDGCPTGDAKLSPG